MPRVQTIRRKLEQLIAYTGIGVDYILMLGGIVKNETDRLTVN